MCLVKNILIFNLVFLLLSSPVHAYLCSKAEMGTNQTCKSSYLDEHEHSQHKDEDTCNTKTSCLSNYSCCTSATLGVFSFLFPLDHFYFTLHEIFISPLEIAKSFYRPPRINLL